MRYGRRIGLGVVLALAAAGGWYWMRGSSGEGEYRYETRLIDRGRIVAKVTATGSVSVTASATATAITSQHGQSITRGMRGGETSPRLAIPHAGRSAMRPQEATLSPAIYVGAPVRSSPIQRLLVS